MADWMPPSAPTPSGVTPARRSAPMASTSRGRRRAQRQESRTGYSDRGVLQAESIEAAQALVAGHPHFGFGPGAELEVHEAMPIGM